MAVYYDVDAEGHTRFAVGIPIEPPTDRVRPAHRAHVTVRPGGRILYFLHVGPYDALGETYAAIGEWMVQHGLMRSPADWERYLPMWEEYLDDPATTPPGELRTRIVIPLPE
jgi:effector-binding domain-containing protein